MANRALQVKADRAKIQRVTLGMVEALKPINIDGNDRRLNKTALREIATLANPADIKRAPSLIVVPQEVAMVLYRPHRKAAPVSALVAAMVPCDGELIKRRDYLKR